jgi:predicted MFS family arabinose efflux permease
MLQSLGLFCGGLLGGMLVRWSGAPALFLACAALAVLWLWSSWRLRVPQPTQAATQDQTLVAPAA